MNYVELTQTERCVLGTFVGQVWGSREFSARLGESGRRLHKSLSEFVFKTRNLNDLPASLTKCTVNWQRYRDEETAPAAENRTTREELRYLESILRLWEPVVRLLDALFPGARTQDEGLPSASDRLFDVYTKLVELHTQLATGMQWKEEVMARLTAEANLGTGDLVAYTIENHRYYHGVARNYMTQAMFSTWFGFPVEHVALAVKNQEGHLFESHMWGSPLSKHTITPFTLGTFGNGLYRFKAEMLVTDSFHAAVHGLFPEQPTAADAIRYAFHLAHHQWLAHHTDFLAETRNDPGWRVLVALMLNTGTFWPSSWRKRAEFGAGDFLKSSTQMSCSEFVVRSWLQTLDLCGQRLAASLVDQFPDVALDGTTIIRNNLISKFRRVFRYSPGQLVYRIVQRDFADAVEPPTWSILFH